MDRLPYCLLLQILSRLKDSADVARCRVASKAFNTVFPGLRSICLKQHINSRSRVSVFLNLISKLEAVESVCIVLQLPACESDNLYLVDGDFAKEWLPRVSGSLKSLSLSGFLCEHQWNVLPLISSHCHNLVNLRLKLASLSVHNLNPMPMLTNLALEFVTLEDEHLNKLNKCFPNLQVLNLVGVRGLKDPKIHLLNLKTCLWPVFSNHLRSLTVIAPKLIALIVGCTMPVAFRVEAPMLYHLHIRFPALTNADAFVPKKFENLKSLWLEAPYIDSMLSEFPITKTVESLTVGSNKKALRYTTCSKFTLRKAFTVLPNLSSLCIRSTAWSELEACLNLEDWEILDGKKGLKTICAYVTLADQSLAFSSLACVLDQCVSLSDVSLLIHRKDFGRVYESFMSKCIARWPRLKWRWGKWSERKRDSWITTDISNLSPQII
ncbi:hypothetical protein L1987_53992 [Smallanthus sonchifolius]|uniref:Uncharacterized protein n=1 Tax=Smallanthus sonchifolius TaxID=185202 RepID=A0ACB9E6J5_9ASTR|nr:hypothetical protein L1987_53992 [Smallanthus sonchifolius]